MKVKLVVVGGKKAGMEIPISTPKFRIGRGERCHIRPQSDLIGDLHCLISVGSDSVTLEDCGGTVGTFVNGKKVQQRCGLQNNDRIKIGVLELDVRLAVHEGDEKKQPIHEARDTADHTATTSPGNAEVDDILRWVKQEAKVSSSPPKVVTLQYAKPERGPPETQAATAPQKPREADDFAADFELEPMDRLLLLTIVPLAAVLLSFLPTFWAWRGGGAILLAALASVFRMRMKGTHGIKWDESNVAIGILAMLIASLMLPTYWVWSGGGVILLVAFSLVLGLRMKRMAGDKLDDTNVALSAAIALLTFIVTSQLSSAVQWGWLGGAVVFFVATSLVLGFGLKRVARRGLDETSVASLAAIALFAFIVIKTWLPATQWVQLSGAIVPLVALTALFGIRAFRLTGSRLDELNLLLLAQIGVIAISALQLVRPALEAWRVGAVLLLVALVPLLIVRMVRMRGSRLNEVNLALLVQIAVLAYFVFKLGLPSTLWSSTLVWATQLRWPGWDVGSYVIAFAVLGLILGLRMKRMAGRRLDDANMALLAAITLLAFIVIKMWPPVAQWAGLAGFVVPLIALAVLFGIRVFRLTGSRLDGLNLLMLSLIGILAISAIHFVRPDWGVWRGGAVLSLAVLVPLFCIRMVWMKGSRLNEVNLTLLVQISLFLIFVGNLWLPSALQPSTLWLAASRPFVSSPTKSPLVLLTPTKLPASKVQAAPSAAAKAQLTKTPPTKAPLVANRPTKAELAKNAPVGNSPTKMQLAKTEPAKAPPVTNEPAKVDPAKNAPVGSAPVKTLPAKAKVPFVANQPAKAEATKNVPVGNAPIKTQLAKADPAKAPPAVNQPAKMQPAKVEPVKNAHAANPPAKAQPVKAELAKNAPAAKPPAKMAPGKAEPARAQPVKAMVAKTPPPKNLPIHIQQTKPPIIQSLSAQQWAGFGGAVVPLVALAALFGFRANRMTGNRLDGLSLLLLSQIGILALSALHLVLPNLGVWQGGAVLLLVALVPLLFIRMVRIDGSTLNEVNLALLVQIGLLVLFIASQWLPSLWVQIIAGIILSAALIPLLGVRMVWKKERKLNEVHLALLVQMGMFAFFVADRWLPSLWVRIGEMVILLAALATMLWLHQKRLIGRKSNETMLPWVIVGIVVVVILGFLFPITSWWPA